MLVMDKEVLKDLLYYNYLNLIRTYDTQGMNRDEFVFKFDEKREYIIFSGIIETISGASCWEEDAQTTEQTAMKWVDGNTLDECLEGFIIRDNEMTEYGFSEIDIPDYYDDKKSFYYRLSTEEINQDDYYNYDKVRTLEIPIEEIVTYLTTSKYAKPFEMLAENLQYTNLSSLLNDNPELKIAYLRSNLKNQLDNELVNKPEEKKKLKI